jgi:hypothetical protein
VLLGAFALLNLLDSRTGRAIRRCAPARMMAEAMGVNTLRYKIGIFLIAALFASISGWLFAHFQRTVNPSPFGLKMGIEYLFMAVLGGVGHVWGAISGALMTKLLEDQLQVLLPRLIGTSGSYEVIVFGIVLVLVLKYLPDGMWSLVGRWLPKPAAREQLAERGPLAERTKPAIGDTVLEVQAIRKQFGGLVAVNDISFNIRAGEIVGLIGPNGAGKSTTFNLITGVLGADLGQVKFRGEVVSGLPSREIARRGMSAHLPARQDDPRDDGAGERGAGRATCAATRARCLPCCAWTAPRSKACCARPRASWSASAWATPDARAGRQPGHGPAAPAGDCPRAVRRPGPAAARRARRRPAPQGESRRWPPCCASCAARA